MQMTIGYIIFFLYVCRLCTHVHLSNNNFIYDIYRLKPTRANGFLRKLWQGSWGRFLVIFENMNGFNWVHYWRRMINLV